VYQWEVLERSYFLSGLGLLFLVGYVVLARVFWFKDPLIGVAAATVLYVAGFIYTFRRH
jgi:branched-subunit amino acid transport protein AzlD